MRIVRWAPQERVDIPDLTAMSFLVLGEFRRHVRGVLLGPDITGASQDANNFIIRGFEVEAQTVPDTTAIVRLDPGSPTALSFAFMSENLGARNESGQVMGGNDSASRTEGNATTTVDFSALGIATYLVEARFIYSDGANDNRAFWDPATNTEFISATDTRFLPAYEVRIVSSASVDEWITLASVAWDGATVDPADISDTRNFAFEGLITFQTADSNQDSFDQFGDFNRSTDRASVGVNEVYPALRALARQVRDVKGPSYIPAPVAGQRWDWFSRPFPPVDYSGTGLPAGAEHTKNLASVDNVSYTIGDGVDTWGDFNGTTGLEDCLNALDGPATPDGNIRPRRVKIVMKAGNGAGVNYVVSTARDFTADGDLHIEIEGASFDGASIPNRTRVSFTGAGTDFMWLKSRGFTLKNLHLSVTTQRQGLIECEDIDAHNCTFQTIPDAALQDLVAGNYALDVNRTTLGGLLVGTRIENCDISGPIRILDSAVDFTTPLNRQSAAVIRNGTFLGPLILNDIIDVSGTDTTRCSSGLLVEGCSFTQNATLQTSEGAMIDGRISENVTVRDCQFNHTTRETDIIHLSQASAGAGTRPIANWLIENNLFKIGATRTSAVDAGQNVTDGTGWAVYMSTSQSAATEDDSSIVIRGNYVEGVLAAINDSGAFFLKNPQHSVIEENVIHSFGADAGSRAQLIVVKSSVGLAPGEVHIRGNTLSKFQDGTGIPTTACKYTGVYIEAYNGARIYDNDFIGRDGALSPVAITMLISSAAVEIQSADYFDIHDNHFRGWDDCDFTVSLEPTVGGGCQFFNIHDNTFEQVGSTNAGSFAIGTLAASVVSEGNISDNVIKTGALGAGIDMTDTADMAVNGNNVQAAASADAVGIQWGTGSVTSICMSNRVNGQSIAGGGAGVIFGLQNSVTEPLNFFP